MSDNEPIELRAYDPRWPAAFAAERDRVVTLIAPAPALVEHVGSTAVPGLVAKPIVDVMLGVGNLADVECRLAALAAAGYRYVPELEAEIPERRFFIRRSAEDGERSHHLHAVVVGSDFWTDHLLFRDLLRQDPVAPRRYGELKQELARRHRDDRKAYNYGKSELIAELLATARRRFRWGGDGCPYTVRPARRDDLEAILSIEARAAVLFRGWGLPEEALAEKSELEELGEAQGRNLLWVAAAEGEGPVGFAWVELLAGQPHLEEMDVDPRHGRRGLGAALVETICAWAASQGLPGPTLTTFRDLPWNAPFYTRLGFRQMKPEEVGPELGRRLEEEAARGLEPRRRVVMRYG